MHQDNRNQPELVPGTPQSAVAEASGQAYQPPPLNLTRRMRLTAAQSRGVWISWPEDHGGGEIKLRPTFASQVERSAGAYEQEMRKVPAIKQRYSNGKAFDGKAHNELMRHTVMLCVMEWRPGRQIEDDDGRVFDVAGMNSAELRGLIAEWFLPPMDLNRLDAPEDQEIDMPFFRTLLGAIGDISNTAAEEMQQVGKDLRMPSPTLSS